MQRVIAHWAIISDLWQSVWQEVAHGKSQTDPYRRKTICVH